MLFILIFFKTISTLKIFLIFFINFLDTQLLICFQFYRWLDKLFEQSISRCHLGDDVHLHVTEWKGERRIDIRWHKHGHPTKTGVSLTPSRYRTLVKIMPILSQVLEDVIHKKEEDFEFHLGGKVYAYVKTPFECVQIRPKYKRAGEIRFSKFGVSLKKMKWENFCKLTEVIDANFSDIKNFIPCSYQESHCNVEGTL